MSRTGVHYDAKSRVLDETTFTRFTNEDTVSAFSEYAYSSGTGVLTGVTSTNTNTPSGGGATVTHSSVGYTYKWWDTAQQETVTYDADTTDGVAGKTTTYNYDANGHLRSAHVVEGTTHDVTYVTDAQGQVMRRTDSAGPAQVYHYFDGVRIGEVGNDGPTDLDYIGAINARGLVATSSAWSNGQSAQGFADFDQAYDPINPTHGLEATPGWASAGTPDLEWGLRHFSPPAGLKLSLPGTRGSCEAEPAGEGRGRGRGWGRTTRSG